jgi:hypothetical protein
MASLREIMAAEISIGAYGCELISSVTEYIPPKGLAISSIIPTSACTINTAFQLVRFGGFRTIRGAITAFANGGGGLVTVTDNDHGLVTGETVTIIGTTSYNGTFEVTVLTHNTFSITATWVANDATGTWTCYTSVSTEEVTAKNWLDTSLPQGTLLFPNWNNPFTSITLANEGQTQSPGSVMVYFIKI